MYRRVLEKRHGELSRKQLLPDQEEDGSTELGISITEKEIGFCQLRRNTLLSNTLAVLRDTGRKD